MAEHELTRRRFVQGCCAGISAMAGARLGLVAFGAPGDGLEADDGGLLVVVFLRGGIDGLSVVPPLAGDDRGHYELARPELAVPVTGDGAARPLDDRFGLHPGAAALHGLYQDGRLAVVHAVGLEIDTRSHFDAMDYMERGTPGAASPGSGWLARHLASAPDPDGEAVMPTLATGGQQPTSLLGHNDTVAMSSPDSFTFVGHWRYADAQRVALRRMYGGQSWLHRAGLETLDAVDTVEAHTRDDYTPANGAQYPDGGFGDQMRLVARMAKLDLGLQVATVDLGGWDTHEYQGAAGGGYLADRLDVLSRGLAALYTDLDDAAARAERLTVVVMSEFGRRLKENASGGTDHGHGNVMLVLGGTVNGGRVHGPWPGLHTDQLYDRADLAIATDYRQVLSEILIRRLGNPNLGYVFPGYGGYAPLGIVQGQDLPPVYATPAPTSSATPGGPTPTPRPTATPRPTRPPGADEARIYLPFAERDE